MGAGAVEADLVVFVTGFLAGESDLLGEGLRFTTVFLAGAFRLPALLPLLLEDE